MLLSLLTARHDTLQRFGKADNLTLVFREPTNPFQTAIDLLLRSQNIEATAINPVRGLLTDLADEFVTKARDGLVRDLNTLTKHAIDEGLGTTEFLGLIDDFTQASGFLFEKPYLAETTFRTVVGVSYGIGERAGYADPDVAEMVWGFRYVSTEDDRTRPDHAALNGTELPKDHPFWDTHWPGAWDWNCRCSHEIVLVDETHHITRPPRRITLDSGQSRALDAGLGINLSPLVNLIRAA